MILSFFIVALFFHHLCVVHHHARCWSVVECFTYLYTWRLSTAIDSRCIPTCMAWSIWRCLLICAQCLGIQQKEHNHFEMLIDCTQNSTHMRDTIITIWFCSLKHAINCSTWVASNAYRIRERSVVFSKWTGYDTVDLCVYFFIVMFINSTNL